MVFAMADTSVASERLNSNGAATGSSSGTSAARVRVDHPYRGLPDRQFWKKDPGVAKPEAFDPVGGTSFSIAPDEAVVTAGSCFAQHVARTLSEKGFDHLVTEQAHPLLTEDVARKHNFGMFSARYGNVYTARQLKQLLLRAYGEYVPLVNVWTASGRGETVGRVVDPFRPQIQPGGFGSSAELEADRRQHFAAVRRAIEQMDVFVFTLGLTECFNDERDGAVYPLAPGVAGGEWDRENVRFRNFDVSETIEDLMYSLHFIRARNPDVKIILTVSPVPLNATYCDRHVMVSTAWSKAVLRIAAEHAREHMEMCDYFPSYEIITSPQTRGRYFGPDAREVTMEGVDHVMRLFLKHYGGADESDAYDHPDKPTSAVKASQPRDEVANHMAEMEAAAQVLCDEEAISN